MLEKQFKNYDNPNNVLTKEDYELIVKTFFLLMGEDVINTGNLYKLPYKIGFFGVRKRPTFGRGVFDYQLFKETGEKVYRKNLHSSKFVGKFVWDMTFPYYRDPKQGSLFRFKPCRDLSRALSIAIREKNTINKYYDE